MKTNKILVALFCLILVFTMTACGQGTDNSGESNGELTPYTFKLAHESGPDGPQQVYAEAFAKYLSELSGGQYDCQIFTVGQLGDTISCVEQCQNGSLDIAFNGYGTLGSLVPAAEIVGLPYVMPANSEDIPDMIQSSQGLNMIAEKMREKNLEVINWVCEGANWWSANKEIRTPKDWKGVKMRVVSTPLTIAQYEAYGASATPVAYTETYSALQLGMVDAQTNPLSCIMDMKFYEVQDYLMDNGSGYLIHGFAINEDVWNGLPEEGKEIVKEAALKANDDFYDYFYDYEAGLIEFFESKGLTIVSLTDEERAAFKELSEGVYQSFIDESADPEFTASVIEQLKKDADAYK